MVFHSLAMLIRWHCVNTTLAEPSPSACQPHFRDLVERTELRANPIMLNDYANGLVSEKCVFFSDWVSYQHNDPNAPSSSLHTLLAPKWITASSALYAAPIFTRNIIRLFNQKSTTPWRGKHDYTNNNFPSPRHLNVEWKRPSKSLLRARLRWTERD